MLMLDPDPIWLTWEDFAMKVYHFWRLVGPQLREQPEEQPRARFPAELAAPPPAAPAVVPASDAPFQLQKHQRVVKHAAFLQCQDCNRQAGRVKATGKYQALQHLLKQPARAAAPPAGEAAGDVGPGQTGTTEDVGPGSTGTTGEGPPGRTGGLATAARGEPARRIWPLFQKPAREPD
eukprot:5334857-Amphidinium_carterae.5